MKYKNDPEVGDLVMVDSRKDDYSLTILNTWEWGTSEIGRFKVNELATVLEDQRATGENGCKILTQSGEVGWVNIHYLVRVK